jgi:hypothetical protein
MLKLNTIQQGKEVLLGITDRITNECIVSAKSDKAKKRLVRTIVSLSDIGESVHQLRKMIDDAAKLSDKLSTNEKDNFAHCTEYLLEALETVS